MAIFAPALPSTALINDTPHSLGFVKVLRTHLSLKKNFNTAAYQPTASSQFRSMSSEKPTANSAPCKSSKRSAHRQRDPTSSRKPPASRPLQDAYSVVPKAGSEEVEDSFTTRQPPLIGYDVSDRRKPDHKFSCLADLVDGTAFIDFTTSDPPFNHLSLNNTPNNHGKRHSMNQRIEDIMLPFKTEPYYTSAMTSCMWALFSICSEY